MGVEYRHYLIPRPNSFLPAPEQLTSLVESLIREKWIAVPGSDALQRMSAVNQKAGLRAIEWALVRVPFNDSPAPYPLTADWFRGKMSGDLRLAFQVEHADQTDLQYPLVNDSVPPDDPYYEIELHLSNDFVHHTSELIDPHPTACVCGEELAFDVEVDVFYAERIRSSCPQCSRAFDPSRFDVRVRDGWSSQESVVKGGTTYRFAVVIDCGSCIPERKRTPHRAHPSLVHLCRKVMGCAFSEIGDIY